MIPSSLALGCIRATTLIGQLGPVQFSQQEALDVLEPLALTTAAVVAYSFFIYRFYKFVARRDVFELRLTRYARGLEHLANALRVVLYLLEYVLLYPILSVAWFLAFTAFLAFLSEAYRIETVLVISMGVVVSIRITAYYDEDLSRDLAKLLPLALLGVFLVGGRSITDVSVPLGLLPQLPLYWKRIVYYLLFLVSIEFLLRLGLILWTRRLQTVLPIGSAGGSASDSEERLDPVDPEAVRTDESDPPADE